jgi:hypothetical protein
VQKPQQLPARTQRRKEKRARPVKARPLLPALWSTFAFRFSPSGGHRWIAAQATEGFRVIDRRRSILG